MKATLVLAALVCFGCSSERDAGGWDERTRVPSSVNRAIAAALAAGESECVVRGDHVVEEPIALPSNFTLVLDGAHLTMADTAFCNMFRSDWTTNVTLVGRNGATADGGKYNGLCERNAGKDGRPPMWVNNLLLFTNVRGFRVEGVRFVNQRWWALNFIGCSHGVVRNVDFLANHESWLPDGSLTNVVGRKGAYGRTKVKNADGVDLRRGCHHILVENVTGFTEDDSVALTCLPGGHEERFLPPGSPCSIEDVVVRNVRTASMCANVRLLAQGGGTMRRITVDGVEDVSDGKTYMVGRGGHAVNLGDSHLYRKPQTRPGEMRDVVVRNVRSRAEWGVRLRGAAENVVVENVVGFDGCPCPFSDERIPRQAPSAKH